MTSAPTLISLALKTSGSEDRYAARKRNYGALTARGELPSQLADIVNNDAPWFCHGLAFRMATYSPANEHLFERWNALLERPLCADGWESEYRHWSSNSDHWAKKWDRFHQFLWLLQCHEYFAQQGLKIAFPATESKAAPDLRISLSDKETVYAECYFYSKWWIREAFLQDVLGLVDPNLRISRTMNIKYDNQNNPFSEEQFPSTLEQAAQALSPERLAKAVAAACIESPQTICSLANTNVSILLDGGGEYIPSLNAHGDPKTSRPTFLSEIINAKALSNNLEVSRPNILMVNGLGADFQLSRLEGQPDGDFFKSSSIDELWIAICGIDEQLAECQNSNKLHRYRRKESGLMPTGR